MSTQELWVPLSVRCHVADAIRNAEAGATTIEWSRAEAAIDALTPWILQLIDSPEGAVTKPTNNRHSLEHHHG